MCSFWWWRVLLLAVPQLDFDLTTSPPYPSAKRQRTVEQSATVTSYNGPV